MGIDAVQFLEAWFQAQCDGDWEHDSAVQIETLDNPGWKLVVNLVGTEHEGRVIDRRSVDRSDTDWIHVWADGSRFHTAAGPRNLSEALAAFREFIDTKPRK